MMKRDVAIVEDVEVPQHGYPDRSMAELLDGLQERLPTRFLREKKWFATFFLVFHYQFQSLPPIHS